MPIHPFISRQRCVQNSLLVVCNSLLACCQLFNFRLVHQDGNALLREFQHFKTSRLLWKYIKVKVKAKVISEAEGKFVPLHTMKAYGTIKLQLHLFLLWVLDGGERLSWRSYCLTAGEIAPVAIQLETGWTPELDLSFWSKEQSSMETWRRFLGNLKCRKTLERCTTMCTRDSQMNPVDVLAQIPKGCNKMFSPSSGHFPLGLPAWNVLSILDAFHVCYVCVRRLHLRLMTTAISRLYCERYVLLSCSIQSVLTCLPFWCFSLLCLNIRLRISWSFCPSFWKTRFHASTAQQFVIIYFFQVILILVFIYGRLEKFVVCLLMTSCSFRESYVRFEEISLPTSSR